MVKARNKTISCCKVRTKSNSTKSRSSWNQYQWVKTNGNWNPGWNWMRINVFSIGQEQIGYWRASALQLDTVVHEEGVCVYEESQRKIRNKWTWSKLMIFCSLSFFSCAADNVILLCLKQIAITNDGAAKTLQTEQRIKILKWNGEINANVLGGYAIRKWPNIYIENVLANKIASLALFSVWTNNKVKRKSI